MLARWRSRRRPQAPAELPDRLLGEAAGERGFTIARRVGGEQALPVDGGLVLLSPARLCRHLLVCGATGSGKTETLLRLAYAVASCSEAPVFYLDGKADGESAERFVGLMTRAGRATRVFPHEPLDGWRGAAHEIHGRLMEVIDYASDGPAAWYRDIAKNVVRLACEHPAGPPRCSRDLLGRIDRDTLAAAHPDCSTLDALSPHQVHQVRLRYEAFFGQARGVFDGDWAWEEEAAAYLLLDSLKLREETAGVARFLFEDFAHYFTTRKPRSRFALLIVDEFSALANAGGMAARIEQARGFNTALVLAPQTVAGMGDRDEAGRILGSVETVVCHRINTPEQIVALAGTRQALDYSSRYTPEGASGHGTTRIRHQFKIDPNRVRALAPGAAYVINCGRAMKVAVLRAPDARSTLPAPRGDAEGQLTVPTPPSVSEKPVQLPF